MNPRPLDPAVLRELDDIDVLRLPYLAVAEARRRGLVTTWDLPSGGYAEALAHLVFGGTAWGAASGFTCRRQYTTSMPIDA